ncbi:sulfite exporter TauE/SafE family protein [Billgrantia bachuensis]|uniref:Probable membrane transporter protein n=1 Tax=Billgrantia bachuensis TaxID=2717286 RepID=A0ABX0PV59_9GAMM|nr:sulfite exporter TauE/SafE family protein [Halomonas bachuensis]NIC07170.1 sulfite exporter TauE/SafE family protein [Halomonas bachuensis]
MFEVTALLFGVLCGLLILLSGVGAGVIMVPGLMLLFGVAPATAVGTASLVSVLIKVVATYAHGRDSRVDWMLFRRFSRWAVPCCLLLALAITLLLRTPWGVGVQHGLKLAVLAAASFALLASFRPQVLQHIGQWLGGLMPSACGAMVGATGVGGGVLIVPTLSAMSNADIKVVVGTSTVIGLLLSACTGLVFGGGGHLEPMLALLVTLGGGVGVVLGRPLVARLSSRAVSALVYTLIGISLLNMTYDLFLV